jgi:TonB family protein
MDRVDAGAVSIEVALPLLLEASGGRPRPGREYVHRFVEALDLIHRPPTDSKQRLSGCVPDRSRSDLLIAFVGAKETTSARVVPESGIVSFGSGRSYRGALFLGDRTEGLRALLAELFPDSSTHAKIDWCVRDAADISAIDSIAAGKKTLPAVKQRVSAEYPEEARRAGAAGTVVVQALVGEDGGVRETAILTSIPAFDESAVRSVEQWRFKPATVDGQPLAVWVSIPVKFALH